MMKTFKIPLKDNYNRPVMKLYGLNALVDTGADIPVFNIPVDFYKNVFESQKNQNTITGYDCFEIELQKIKSIVLNLIKMHKHLFLFHICCKL